MDEAETDSEAVARLRATAHPVRLRILSLLTAEAMSAAEVARALGITHANASYHLRLLHDIGELVVESEEKIRGGVAKRYRYDATREVADRTSGVDDRVAYARANAAEVERRLFDAAKGPGSSSDLETWVPVEAWHRALDLLHEASHLLHAAARPAGTPETIHVSFTSNAFTMSGGLTGEAVRWTPARRRPDDLVRGPRPAAQPQLRVVLRLALREHAGQHDGDDRARLRRARHHGLPHRAGAGAGGPHDPDGGAPPLRRRDRRPVPAHVGAAGLQPRLGREPGRDRPARADRPGGALDARRALRGARGRVRRGVPRHGERAAPARGPLRAATRQCPHLPHPQRDDGARPDRWRTARGDGRVRAGRSRWTPPPGCSPPCS